MPSFQYRGPKYPSYEPQGVPNPEVPATDSGMLYTGDNMAVAARLMESMWARNTTLAQAVVAASTRAEAAGLDIPETTENAPDLTSDEESFVDATAALSRGLNEFGLVMGTSASTSLSLLMEPAFIPTQSNTSGTFSRSPLYFTFPDCNALSFEDRLTLARLGQAISNLTSLPVQCASLPPVWQSNTTYIDDQLYCGWNSAECVVRYGNKVYLAPEEVQQAAIAAGRRSIQEYVGGLYDWKSTAPSGFGALDVAIWVNNSNVALDPGPPYVQRWNQPVNLAANAWLKEAAGPAVRAGLMGVKDMPKGPSRLSLDFSSLLGPLFMMWFMQLMLPVNVFMLVQEKEAGLRIMMKMQGLKDGAYYAVQYVWMVLLYCLFMAIFVIFGSLIGLKIFTLNSYSVQFVCYFLWGNLLASLSFYSSAWNATARPAVLLAVVWVIISGFMANLMMVQYIESGPEWIAKVLEFVPAFGLFRCLYELSQYAFLADRNGGQGLTWSDLSDEGNGMIRVWIIFVVEWAIFPIIAYYMDQVRGAGTGMTKHPLFFLGVRHKEEESGTGKNGFKNKEKKSGSGSGMFQWWKRKRRTVTTTTAALEKKASSPVGKGVLDITATSTSMMMTSNLAYSPTTTEEDAPPTAVLSPMDFYYGSSDIAITRDHDHDNQILPVSDVAAPFSPQPVVISSSSSSVALAGGIERKVTSVKLAMPVDTSAHRDEDDDYDDYDEDDQQCQAEDIVRERQLALHHYKSWIKSSSSTSIQQPPASIILHKLRKVYPARDGNAPKLAVANLSLSIQRSECFGLLGPNGAGKTSTIRMMEGFMVPSSGTAIIEGLSIRDDMDSIHSLMGACPQHDLLWEGLTGREHLLFYGRLKNIDEKGGELKKAVEESLRAVNLHGVGDNPVSSYSGGMKRRLSVAIAFIGDPAVVYLDEPSTGLDPASRRLLWEVIKKSRKNRAIILTTHSMEEAESLCDRLGIFVNGRLRCVGDPKDLTARFGGYLSFSITTPVQQEDVARRLVVERMAPGAKLVYALGGTQKYELPLEEVSVDGVFREMERAKIEGVVEVLDWGVSNATLEECFINICRSEGVEMSTFA